MSLPHPNCPPKKTPRSINRFCNFRAAVWLLLQMPFFCMPDFGELCWLTGKPTCRGYFPDSWRCSPPSPWQNPWIPEPAFRPVIEQSKFKESIRFGIEIKFKVRTEQRRVSQPEILTTGGASNLLVSMSRIVSSKLARLVSKRVKVVCIPVYSADSDQEVENGRILALNMNKKKIQQNEWTSQTTKMNWDN